MNRSKESISYNMYRIRSSGTSIEKTLGRALWSYGLRYRKQYTRIPGKPDFVLVKSKVAIFCDSSFWHGYKNLKTNRHKFKTNSDFWINKINGNIKRDRKVNTLLKKSGWKVIRFWDFQINKDVDKCVQIVLKLVK